MFTRRFSRLAPFVWLLLVPPRIGATAHQRILIQAPLAKWTIMNQFEGEAACTRFRFELWGLTLQLGERNHLKNKLSDFSFSKMCCVEAS
jgi:hypothetical protein